MIDVQLVEVGPRDGFQPIEPFIPTKTKIALVQQLHRAGGRRMEVTAFVSARSVPQLADAETVLAAARALPGLDAQVLVPNRRFCERALQSGADHIAFVLSVSERHNLYYVRRTPAESAAEYLELLTSLPGEVRVRLNVATAFDCPFDGPLPAEQTLAILDRLVPARPDIEVALCDTTGRATPDRVQALFTDAVARYPATGWAFHGHDTYGLGVANALAALHAGASALDASIAGLGGCPFAPGATGNVATEDLIWTLHEMGHHTGYDLGELLHGAELAAALPGASPGGRVRVARSASACVQVGG